MIQTKGEPLVSIMIPNYNYAHYLGQCLQSACNQTYKNLEIIVLDNNSTDNSIEVASKYLYDDRVSVMKNQVNILNYNYKVLSDTLIHGDYMILLCSDDFFINEHFIEYAVEIMEKNPEVGYVHGEKQFVDADGRIINYDSFYNCSFIAPGLNVMPLYMITTIGHPSQGIIRKTAFKKIYGYAKEIDHMNADRVLWFYLSRWYDAAYIREKMCGIRWGAGETMITQKNFQHPILCYLTILDFLKYAEFEKIDGVLNRKEEAFCRLANEFTRYGLGALLGNDIVCAERYMDMSYMVCRDIINDDDYKLLKNAVVTGEINKEAYERILSDSDKKRNYNPPSGYRELKVGIDYA